MRVSVTAKEERASASRKSPMKQGVICRKSRYQVECLWRIRASHAGIEEDAALATSLAAGRPSTPARRPGGLLHHGRSQEPGLLERKLHNLFAKRRLGNFFLCYSQ